MIFIIKILFCQFYGFILKCIINVYIIKNVATKGIT